MRKSAFEAFTPDLRQFMKDRYQAIRHGWNHFFFGPVDLYPVSLFRMILGFAFLGMYLIRWTHFDYFFLNDGVLPFEWARKILPEGYGSILPFYLESDLAMRVQGILHIFLIVLFTLGVIGRNLTWLLFILNLGLMQRNMSIVYGADLFGSFWLFYLSFVQHDKYFSVKNYFKKHQHVRINLPEPVSDPFSSVGVRLLQIQLCIAYAYTGIEKLKGHQWWEGSAVWYVIGMEDLIPHNFTFMVNFPNLIGFLTMFTVIFEVYFIFAVRNKSLKVPWLLTGLFFHLSTAVFMDLWFFCTVMTSCYIVFIEPKTLRFFAEKVRRLIHRPPNQADIMVGMS